MIRTRIEVRNMACEMCEAHVIEAVRKILSHGEARRIRASHRRNEVTIESEAPLSESLVRECIRSCSPDSSAAEPAFPFPGRNSSGFLRHQTRNREFFRGNHFCFTAYVTKPLQ